MVSILLNTSIIAALSVAAPPVDDANNSAVQHNMQHIAVLAAFGDANMSRTVEQAYCERMQKERPSLNCTSLRSADSGIDDNDNAAFIELASQNQADHVLVISWTGLSVQSNRETVKFREVSLEDAQARNFGFRRNSCYQGRVKNEFALNLVALNSRQVVQSGEVDTYGLVHSGVRTVSRSIARLAANTITVATSN